MFFSQKRGDKIAHTTVGELRKLIEGVPDDAKLFFDIDVKYWPKEEIDWTDETRIVALDFEHLSVHKENAPFQVVHFVIVGELGSVRPLWPIAPNSKSFIL